ncbi:23S rRNA m(6)A-1618 methyltransferase [Hyunsoonleella jejuensis]|uniref:Ribosomal RNA large subunit methyltransferase F n=1 Tax=Hyunsoonleella jejuensis TaxID=419940 RepID=A0A1H9BQ26_9FLAO|nr:23S rRNA (adenine(1618)-N(6))-methyltransferase RlmF [Hyunsoonleella jejuensis]SEP90801.1 23S rRNA m(6)A-1618 methyltransferase [Hyunsoonleella jejuensis]
MQSKKNQLPKEKTQLHPRNKHRGRYEFAKLIDTSPELAQFVKPNKYGNQSINFFDPAAVKTLNIALLKQYYNIKYWDIPKYYLCPPIPGRADYIHNIADLLASSNEGIIPKGKNITCLDIGVGANCIYPIIGNHEYNWSFIGSDVDAVAIASARKIVEQNPGLKDAIELRLQNTPRHIFDGVIRTNEKFDVTICNPPFHSSAEEAEASAIRKIKNLTKQKPIKPVLNFGGKPNELWCKGGEAKFVKDMIFESRKFKTSCFWFTTLVSKESNLRSIYNTLKKVEAKEVKTLSMGQGNKISRLVAWTFLDKTQQDDW